MFGTKQSRTEAAAEQVRNTASDLGSAASDRLDTFKELAAAEAALAASKAKDGLESARSAAAPRLHDAADVARDRYADAADAARDRYAAAKDAAGPAVHDATEAARERLAEAVAAAKVAATDAAHEAADRAKPRIEHARESAQSTLFENVLPRLSAAATAAVTAFAAGAEQAKEAAAPRLDQARETAYLGTDRAKDAYHVLKGEAVAKPKGGGRGKWLIGIGLVAAVVAAVAAFRKQQRADDPWATPLNDGTSGAYSGATSTGTTGSAGSSLKDRAAEQVEHAKEVIGEAADKAKDKAGDLAAKGQSALADAKDKVADVADDAKDKAANATDAKDATAQGDSLDGIDDDLTDETVVDVQVDGPADGQVTSVEPTFGSDAVDGAATRPVAGDFTDDPQR